MYDFEVQETCFECDWDLDFEGNEYSCEECGKKYFKEEYEKLVDEKNEEYLAFVMKKNPELFQ